MENKGWSVVSSENHLPRLWLMLPEGHLLISWETIGKVRASPDFLSISFECEYGVIQINSATTLQELFENLQLEKTQADRRNQAPNSSDRSGVISAAYW